MVRGFAVFFLWLDALWTMFGSYFSRLGFFPFWARCLGWASSVHVLFFFFHGSLFFLYLVGLVFLACFFTRTFGWAISWSASLHNDIEHSNKSLDRWMLSFFFFTRKKYQQCPDIFFTLQNSMHQWCIIAKLVLKLGQAKIIMITDIEIE